MNLDQQSLSMALEYLDKVGAKIGMTAETIWPWMVRQQYVYVGLAFTVLFIACILVPIALRISNKRHPFDDKLYGTEKVDFKRILFCGTIIASVIFSVLGTFGTIFNLPKLFNPEFYALKDLLTLIK